MGVQEKSYYPALSKLFNSVGSALKPKVQCVFEPANLGAGSPDVGLFTPDQLQNSAAGPPLPGQIPSRAVVEVKGTPPTVLKSA